MANPNTRSFDTVTRSLSIAASFSRSNLVISALALTAPTHTPIAATGERHENDEYATDGSPLVVAVADRTTAAVALLTCPAPPLPAAPTLDGSARHAGGPRGIEEDSRVPGVARAQPDAGGNEGGGGNGNDPLLQNQTRTGSPVPLSTDPPPLRLIRMWPCAETVRCLEASGTCAISGVDDVCHGDCHGMGFGIEKEAPIFVVGTEEGAIRIIRPDVLSNTAPP